MQCGAALATELFSRGGVAGTAFLRCSFAAIVLVSVTRPRLRGRSRADLSSLIVFGVLLAGAAGFVVLGHGRGCRRSSRRCSW
jgi:inner membrane transporter RhtA